ncbi:4232_t:CDS:10, partial [Ambispora gerdemannii]
MSSSQEARIFLSKIFSNEDDKDDNDDNGDHSRKRAFVTLTYAQSLDAKIAGRGGKKLVISGHESMIMTHRMRTLHDGILVGIGTIFSDDPRLTARLIDPDEEKTVVQPQPIILDSSLRFPLSARLLKQIKKEVGDDSIKSPWIFTSDKHDPLKRESLEQAGAKVFVIETDPKNGHLSLAHLLTTLSSAPLSLTRIMVEGGSTIIKSFLSSGLVDQLVVTIAPIFVGGDGLSVFDIGKLIDNNKDDDAADSNKTQEKTLKFPLCDKVTYKQFGKDMVMSAQLTYNQNELPKNEEFLEKSMILTKNLYDELLSSSKEEKDLNSNYLELIMWILRMIRNFVAEIEENQNYAMKYEWHKIIEEILVYCTSNLYQQPNQQTLLLNITRSGTQALSNIITGNSSAQKIIWDELLLLSSLKDKEKVESFNEDLLSKLASCGDDIVLLSTLVLVFNTMHDNESRCKALIESSVGARLLKIILHEAGSSINEAGVKGEKEAKKSFELIYALISRIIELDLFPLLFEKLYDSEEAKTNGLTQNQIVLLKLLYSKLFNDNSPLLLSTLSQACSYLVRLFNSITPEIIKEMEAIKNQQSVIYDNNTSIFTDTLTAELKSEDDTISTRRITCLRLLLNIIGDSSQFIDDEINEEDDYDNNGNIREYLFKNGILANLAYENRIVQDEVRRLGGIQLILNQCNIDDNNPFLREQSIFAIRNLLYQNSENQKLVGELTPIRAVQSEVLDDLGISAKIVDGDENDFFRSNTNTSKSEEQIDPFSAGYKTPNKDQILKEPIIIDEFSMKIQPIRDESSTKEPIIIDESSKKIQLISDESSTKKPIIII